ncbi:MAG: hypothetical protein WBB62_16495 [Rhodococcus sp. (in: high G+C Gram-positive bacteria)]
MSQRTRPTGAARIISARPAASSVRARSTQLTPHAAASRAMIDSVSEWYESTASLASGR